MSELFNKKFKRTLFLFAMRRRLHNNSHYHSPIRSRNHGAAAACTVVGL